MAGLPDVTGFLDSFLDYLAFEKRCSPHTIISYRTDLTQFRDYLATDYENLPMEQANFQIIRSWIVSLMDQKMTARSVNRKITALRTFYRFLLINEKIPVNPML